MVSRRPSVAGDLEPQPEGVATASGHSIGGRYDVRSELGRGGMACVYHAVDSTNGREVALKQLTGTVDEKRAAETAALFEREFHTLAQLSHPRVIRVYDYGIDPAGPYYTMELLDGGDLRERSPLPWREACELIFDVCSSLALLHSRRLVHRDVSPRNVRCTRDGHAKLIDFGAMVPMGASAHLVGTAPFVAPEALHGSPMDARTDLFSLGATLYFALTGRLAFPARDFSQLLEIWSNKPVPPSAANPGIPPALDQLVLSMISLEPAPRPRSAFEVMQRLATVAEIRREESLDVSKAYLVTPGLVGRDEALAAFREHLQRAQHGRGRAVLFEAVAGAGRSRMLDACVLEAKMLGACVVRSNAAAGSGRGFAAVHSLATQLAETHPELAVSAARASGVLELLFEPVATAESTRGAANDVQVALRSFERPGGERLKLQRALLRWFLQVSKKRLLVLAVDDADRIDEPSLAVLASLADRARRHSLVSIASSERRDGAEVDPGVDALKTRCEVLDLRALDVAETESLLSSVFGDVPNLALVTARIQAVAQGNPRQTMVLAQHLVDAGAIQYDGGTWSLPERLTAADMPASTDDAFRARVAALDPLARRLFLTRALADPGPFSREDFRLLAPGESSVRVDAALDHLLGQQLLTGDGRSYDVAQRTAADLACEGLEAGERREIHRSLAALYTRADRSPFVAARQLLLAEDFGPALDALLPLLRGHHDRVQLTTAAQLSIPEVCRTLALAFMAACEQRRPLSEQMELRHWLTLLSVVDDESYYWLVAPGWRAQLEHDSGWNEWRKREDIADAGQRLTAALQHAVQQHGEAPAGQRGYAPDQAIRLLVHYVAVSIAIGARTLDTALLLSLPDLLAPFAPLSPLVHAIWQNALATRESSCYRQYERSQERWRKIYADLEHITGQDQQIVSSIRYAIAFGMGLSEASIGLQSANDWAEILDRDALQRVNAMYLRKVIRLQQGDLEAAERYRKQAELLALQSSSRQMFTNVLTLEIGVHFAAWDLTGVKQIAARIEPLAERHPGWVPFRHLAEGHYQRLRGDLTLALQAYERCLALSTPDPNDPGRSIIAWPLAAAPYVETLIGLDRVDEAKAIAERTLAHCDALGMGTAAFDLARMLALADAKLGDHAGAVQRLDALIERQRALGVTGLILGASYESRTRVAIWAGDRPAVERFARLTADQYRHGRGSSLGARYERLMDEARGSGVVVLPPLSPFETTMFGNTETGARVSAIATIAKTMAGAPDGTVRAQRALQLMCDSRGARGGHLFLAGQSELRLAASVSASAPDDVLERLVSDFWAHQFDDVDPDTAPASDGTSLYSTQAWSDRKGTSYQPVLVTGKLNGAIVNAGVALLVPGDASADLSVSIPLIAELAGYLIKSGDSQIAS